MKFVPNVLTTKIARTALLASKASPQVLFVAGVVGVGATVVLACRATLKVEEVLEEHEKGLLDVQEVHVHTTQLSVTELRKDTAYVYLRTTRQLAVLYGPAVICGVASISALTGSHNILTKRNAGLAAAYGTLEKAFDGYRSRVREAYGEDRERDLYLDVQACEIENPETGKVIKRNVAQGGAPYMFLFDEHNRNWESTPEYNFLFLKLQQNWANQRLQARGHVFLNEVLESLGMEHTPAGAVTGWVKDDGDGYIDFGFMNRDNEEQMLDFMTGREKAIWLNFNVDGVIYKKI